MSSVAEQGIKAASVARAHDQMVDEYDQLDDLWYPWLFAQIHDFIASDIGSLGSAPRRAIDVGCGTGFQSFLLAQAGFDVTGFDLARALVERAKEKTARFAVPPLEAPPLFQTSCQAPWITRHHSSLAERLERARLGRKVQAPQFVTADLMEVDFRGQDADVIVCCGSVLSFVDDATGAIERLVSWLRPGGRLYLEVEQRWNADLLWPFVDNLTGGWLQFDQSWSGAWQNLTSHPAQSVRIKYPFSLHSGEEVALPIWLFTVPELLGIFERVGLMVRRRIGVHQLSNLLPSTVLHSPPSNRVVSRVFEGLRRLDARLASVPPFWRLGCSVVFALEKSPTADRKDG